MDVGGCGWMWVDVSHCHLRSHTEFLYLVDVPQDVAHVPYSVDVGV